MGVGLDLSRIGFGFNPNGVNEVGSPSPQAEVMVRSHAARPKVGLTPTCAWWCWRRPGFSL